MQESAVKKYALSRKIPVLQPSNLKDETFLNALRSFKANLQVVVAFRMLPELVWNMPEIGTFNLHASLLPNYRGAAPINWAIINGEQVTGLTTFFLKHQIDTGDLLLQKQIPIAPNETAGSLHDKLMKEGGQLVLESLKRIEQGDYKLIPQDQLMTSTNRKEAPKIFKHHCKIDWSKSSTEIDRLVRGMSPYPTAWSTLEHVTNGKKLNLKIFDVKPISGSISKAVGKITVVDKAIFVDTADQQLQLLEIQLEGKKKMNAKDLLNGFDMVNYHFCSE